MKRAMKSFAKSALFSIGVLLLFYVFSIGEIWNNHSPGNYLILCTGIISFALGCLPVAIDSRET